jgi:hypothetical protein
MARRADPERIFEARRTAIQNRLTSTGMDEATAERWCDAWIIEAIGRGLDRMATTRRRRGMDRGGRRSDGRG